MEVETQWRRQWAGAAEYGKVTEGGVTRRVARALEVLHASRPGTQVRVMRAAWHSSAGPGAPASSYMVHSSQQFISSGSRLLASPSLIKMSKPLEISSTPLDSSPDEYTDTENYKVTEPDDIEISQPSKWKISNNRTSLRMPSEESSSTDVSIIDLDSKNNSLKRHSWRRHSYDSENSDLPRSKSRTSPLLESPITLSTLKYKSLLNNSSNSWENRRKSYGFEDSSTMSDNEAETKDISVMESSTDSGICKSSELVNEKIDEEPELKYINSIKNQTQDDSFQDWLARNRPKKVHKIHINVEKDSNIKKEPVNSQFSLQSTGKVTISLADEPITVSQRIKDYDDLRKTKRVEFCKTELHFAADSGRVNIISTDEKPPPTNDFRRRRSAFVPINNNFDKPVVTLFKEKFDDILVINGKNKPNEISDEVASDDLEENAAATKGILKNKIPKPKPYILGENMEFGDNYSLEDNFRETKSVINKPSAVNLINKQLQEPLCVKKKVYECRDSMNNWTEKNKSEGPNKRNSLTNNGTNSEQNDFKRSIKLLQSSPILQAKSRTRQLKESELTYFGIKSKDKEDHYKKSNKVSDKNGSPFKHSGVTDNNDFNAVRLVQQASDNTPKSNKISEEYADYQNLPLKEDFIPIPTPRSRFGPDLKMEEVTKGHNEIVQEIERRINTRRSRLKNHVEVNSTLRSISEPPKHRNSMKILLPDTNISENKHLANYIPKNSPVTSMGESNKMHATKRNQDKSLSKQPDTPLYQNIKIEKEKVQHKSKIESNETLQKDTPPRLKTKKSSNRAATPDNKNTVNDKIQQNDSIKLNKSNKHSHKHNLTKHESNGIHEKNTIEKPKVTEKDVIRNKYNKDYTSKDSHTRSSTKNNNKGSNGYSSQHVYNTDKKPDKYSDNKKPQTHNRNNETTNSKQVKRHTKKEYVLNYDDKNGTFSSMNKVKHRSKSSDRGKKYSSVAKKSSDSKPEEKNDEKYHLLQYPPWNNNNKRFDHSEGKKRKSKVYMERTCQLL